jgi:hypothetical protein
MVKLKDRRPTDAERLGLARTVFAAIYRRAESYDEADIGECVAYLMGAIVCRTGDVFQMLEPLSSGQQKFLRMLRDYFPPEDAVWQFIEIA